MLTDSLLAATLGSSDSETASQVPYVSFESPTRAEAIMMAL